MQNIINHIATETEQNMRDRHWGGDIYVKLETN